MDKNKDNGWKSMFALMTFMGGFLMATQPGGPITTTFRFTLILGGVIGYIVMSKRGSKRPDPSASVVSDSKTSLESAGKISRVLQGEQTSSIMPEGHSNSTNKYVDVINQPIAIVRKTGGRFLLKFFVVLFVLFAVVAGLILLAQSTLPK